MNPDQPPAPLISGPKAKLVQRYFQVQVETASADEMLLLLLDGAVRFVEGALEAAESNDFEKKNTLLLKTQAIVLALRDALSPEIGEAIFRNLNGLYYFVYQKLVEGNIRNDRKMIGEGLTLLQGIRETWRQAVALYRQQQAPKQEQKTAEGQGICISG